MVVASRLPLQSRVSSKQFVQSEDEEGATSNDQSRSMRCTSTGATPHRRAGAKHANRRRYRYDCGILKGR
ncbi:unnamed protein product [Sympodiomycopsis kandeliae]